MQRQRAMGVQLHVLFLDATTATLVRRFSETRRRHPLSPADRPDGRRDLVKSIEHERELLAELREYAHRDRHQPLRGPQLQSTVRAPARRTEPTS